MIGAAVAGGLALALLQPLPYALLSAINNAVSPDPDRWVDPASAFSMFWGSPAHWAAVVGFTATVAVMLWRVGRPSGGYVGAVIAASVASYVLVGALAEMVTSGWDAESLVLGMLFPFILYGTAWLAAGVAVVLCWWARRAR